MAECNGKPLRLILFKTMMMVNWDSDVLVIAYYPIWHSIIIIDKNHMHKKNNNKVLKE